MIILILDKSQTYHWLFLSTKRNLIEFTWNLITSSSNKVFEKIFWARNANAMTFVKEKTIWVFLSLLKNFFSFNWFFQRSVIRNLLNVFFRDDNDAIFWTFSAFLTILIFFFSESNRCRDDISSICFAFFSTFCEIFVMMRSRSKSSFFTIVSFHFSDRNTLSVKNFFLFAF